jgi:hypothetical protein
MQRAAPDIGAVGFLRQGFVIEDSDTDALPAVSAPSDLQRRLWMKSIHRDLVKIRALIEAIKEAKIAGYINPVIADWVLEELKEATGWSRERLGYRDGEFGWRTMPARGCGKRQCPAIVVDAGQRSRRESFWGSGGWLRCLRRSYLHLLEHVLCRACGKIEELFRLLGRLSCKFLEKLSVQF